MFICWLVTPLQVTRVYSFSICRDRPLTLGPSPEDFNSEGVTWECRPTSRAYSVPRYFCVRNWFPPGQLSLETLELWSEFTPFAAGKRATNISQVPSSPLQLAQAPPTLMQVKGCARRWATGQSSAWGWFSKVFSVLQVLESRDNHPWWLLIHT